MLEPIEARVPVRLARLERIPASPEFVAQPMDLFNRLGAAMTQLVKRFEDPAKMLRLSRFELEGSLMTVNRKIRRAASDLCAAQSAAQAEAASEQGWSDKADVALAHGRDELARSAIAQRLLAGERSAAAITAVASLAEAANALAADAERLRTAIADVWTRQRAVTDRFADASNTPDERRIDEELETLKAERLNRAN